MPVDLKLLAEALATQGWEAGSDLTPYYSVSVESGDAVYTRHMALKLSHGELECYWNGEEEHPVLAFAMLDVLERANLFPLLGRYLDQGGCFKVRIYEAGMVPTAFTAPTRTAAVAEALVYAHQAGLIPTPTTPTEPQND